MAKHRIEFVKLRRAPFERFNANPRCYGNIGKVGLLGWQKFVKRRIKQADRDGQSRHFFKNAFEISALFGEQLGERNAPARFVFGKDHLAHRRNPARLKKHMLGAAQPDTFGTKFARDPAVGGRFGVGAHLHPPRGIGPDHQC